MSNRAKEPKAPVFSKEQILGFKRYERRRDLLSVLLQEGKSYTAKQVDTLLADFVNKTEVAK